MAASAIALLSFRSTGITFSSGGLCVTLPEDFEF